MLIGERLKFLRESKGLSQGDIEKVAGVRRGYVSRVENDHTTPTIETLEKWSTALEIPLYAIFYQGSDDPPQPRVKNPDDSPKDARYIQRLQRSLSRMQERDRELLLKFATLLTQKRPSTDKKPSEPRQGKLSSTRRIRRRRA